MRALREVYTALAEDARQEAMSPAAEWLLDNFHIISAASRDIHHDLPPSFFKRLRRSRPTSSPDFHAFTPWRSS
jgi:cyclic beta-1,2-glucan synthetase